MNCTKVEYQELRKALKKYDEKVMDKYDDLSINFKGCMTEELCYNDIKSYFNERKETVLVINGLFLQNREGKCFTYGTKTIANLTTYSRKPGN